MKKSRVIAVTSGEPAGIGPDICLHIHRIQQQFPLMEFVVLADKSLLEERARLLGLPVNIRHWQSGLARAENTINVVSAPLKTKVIPGELNSINSAYVLDLLDKALEGCVSGAFAAMVSAPVHKGIINASGASFTGHTEYLAKETQTQRVVMMLVGGGLKVALVTTHMPLKDVPMAITPKVLEDTIHILHQDMQEKYGINAPRILVAGLNPHAGEGGYLGKEEIEIIIPVLDRLRAKGMDLIGPLSADTMFTPPFLEKGDCILAMYHDQGLATLKHMSFGQGVNVTLGLPIIRTSVDHGTALELAGTGRADPGSLLAAIKEAIQIVERTK